VGPWGFVGRADELRRLVTAATSGAGHGLILSGIAGVGKSRLLREGIAALPTEHFAVWNASANAATSGLPLGGFTSVLPADQPSGLTPAGLLRWAVDTLHQRAAGRPIVFAIDDAHLLDPVSATLVYLIARSDRASVLGTLRSGEPVPQPIRALWTDDLVDHVELQPFTATETAELLGQMVEGQFDSSSAERLWRISAGNALMLRELVIAAQASGEFTRTYGVWRWNGRLELAPSLTDMIDARIGRLSDEVREVVELVAFGEPIGLPLLVRATDPAAAELAEERGLIRVSQDDRRTKVRLGHPLYGEVLRRHCPITRKRRLLAELASLMESVGARRREDLLRVAVWRLDSATGRDPELLLRAGRHAFATYDMPLAERLARAALDTGGGFDAAELLATILMFCDRPSDALSVIDAARPEANTDERLSHWLGVQALTSYWGLGDESTIEKLGTGAQVITDPGHRAWVSAFESIMKLHHLELAGALRECRAVLDRPASPMLSRALANCTIAHLQAARGELVASTRTLVALEADAARWRAEAPYFQLAVELARGTNLILAHDLPGVDTTVAAEFADLFDAGDFRLGSGYLAVVRAQAARLRGQVDRALQYSRQACAILASSRVFAGLAHAERAHAAALHADPAIAAEAAEAMADSDRTHTGTMGILDPWREQARAWVAASTGDLAAAVRLLRRLAVRLRADGLAGHELLALYDLVRLGDTGPVTDIDSSSDTDTYTDRIDVTGRLIELASIVEGPMAGLIAVHSKAIADHDAAGLMLVADLFAARQLHLFAAEAAAAGVTGLREIRSPQLASASAVLAEMLNRCPHVRSPALASTRPRLTDREHQVARLAAAGVSSKQIADRLFLSARTVDNHLLRVYAKLGIGGRAELGAMLRTLADQPPSNVL
jgi:DNA-binding CsgD family transcriptional regulator